MIIFGNFYEKNVFGIQTEIQNGSKVKGDKAETFKEFQPIRPSFKILLNVPKSDEKKSQICQSDLL